MSVCVREGGAYNTPKQAVDLVNDLLEFEIGICWRKLQFQQKTINLEFGDGGGETKVDEERGRVRGSGTGKRGERKGGRKNCTISLYCFAARSGIKAGTDLVDAEGNGKSLLYSMFQ